MNLMERISDPTLSAPGALMVLPTGQVLVSNSTLVKVYTPANTKFPSKWAPTIKQFPATVVRRVDLPNFRTTV